jgi:hypothetical protein
MHPWPSLDWPTVAISCVTSFFLLQVALCVLRHGIGALDGSILWHFNLHQEFTTVAFGKELSTDITRSQQVEGSDEQ